MSSHYVCDVCAHTWSSPEHPDACENCNRSSAFIVVWDTLENAEEHSQRILDDEAEARAQLAARRRD